MAADLRGFDRRQLNGAPFLVGIDEAGRGCLAGPVVAAAIRCEREFYSSPWARRHCGDVDDSKRLAPARRAEIVERFGTACERGWVRIGIGTASVEEIGHLNIYHASSLAMRRALEQVMPLEERNLWHAEGGATATFPVLIDGKPIRNFPVPHRAVVKGDQQSLSIALAGIHAKEWRDAHMRRLDEQYPGYGFAVHKGYGTQLHLASIEQRGTCPEHRAAFLVKFRERLGERADPLQGSLF